MLTGVAVSRYQLVSRLVALVVLVQPLGPRPWYPPRSVCRRGSLSGRDHPNALNRLPIQVVRIPALRAWVSTHYGFRKDSPGPVRRGLEGPGAEVPIILIERLHEARSWGRGFAQPIAVES